MSDHQKMFQHALKKSIFLLWIEQFMFIYIEIEKRNIIKEKK